MSEDLSARIPGQALMEQLVAAQDDGTITWLPFGIVYPSDTWMSWLRGIRGEIDVADRLKRLGPEWTVLHSLPIGDRDSDIDHVVVGPGGVFTINSKRHVDKKVWIAGGSYLVSGQKTGNLRNAEYEARRVRAKLAAIGLDVPVTPVVAISGAKEITIKRRPEWNGVPIEVVSAGAVRRRIGRRRKTLLAPELVRAVGEAAARTETWGARPRFSTDLAELTSFYHRVNRGVGRWNVAVLLTAITVLAAALGLLLPCVLPQIQLLF